MNIYSLKLKFFIILALISGCVFLLQKIFFVPQLEDFETKEAIVIQDEVAQRLATGFELSFKKTIAEIETIAKMPEIVSLKDEDLDRILTEMNRISHLSNYYFIVDTDGRWLSYPSKPHLKGDRLQNDYWIKDVLHNKTTTFVDVHLAKSINKMVSGFAAPIFSKDGDIIALLRGVITVSGPNSLIEHLKNIKISKNGYVYLVDSRGKILAHPDIQMFPEKMSENNYAAHAPVSLALKGESGVTEYSYDNQVWIAAYQPIPTTGWALIAQQPKKNITQHTKEEVDQFTHFLFIAFFLIVGLLVLFFFYSLNPLTRLLKEIRTGQPLKPHTFPKDEIGTLAKEFSNYSGMLEEQVTLQTEELRHANKELKNEIIERKKAEADLLNSNALHKSILRAAPIGIGLVKNRIFNWVSDKVVHMTGYSQEELVGQSAKLLYPSEDEFDRVGRIKYGQLQQHLTVGEVDTIWKKKDGTLIDVHLSSTPLNPDDFSEGVIFSAVDITDRKRMEQDLHRAHKLESLGILAGGIAHDFNNLLQSIIGNLSLAKLYADKNEKVYTKLDETEKAASRATALTLQLLTFAKGGAPVKTRTHLANIIKNSVAFSLQGSNVSCEYFFTHDLWLVDVDEGQLNQVIQNLVINSIHAMPNGGKITVRAENCQVKPGNDIHILEGKYVRITLQDEGIGIPEENLPRIFDPYYSTKQKGSGLGLAVAYSIVTNHSGLLTVESEAGHGTTFHIFLPATDAEAKSDSMPVENDIHKGEGKVLVMDDELHVLGVAVEMLEMLGYEVTTIRDGRSALEQYEKALHEEPYVFVILDLTVPGGMGGEETVRRLLELDPDAKAFVSSGYANDPIMANFQRYGFCGIIPKPYTIENLSNALNTFFIQQQKMTKSQQK